MRKRWTIVVAGALLLAGCGGARTLVKGKYRPGTDTIPDAAGLEVSGEQIILTLKDGHTFKYDYKVTAQNGNTLTLEVIGGTLVEKTNLDVLVEKDGITFDVKSYFTAVLEGKWQRTQ